MHGNHEVVLMCVRGEYLKRGNGCAVDLDRFAPKWNPFMVRCSGPISAQSLATRYRTVQQEPEHSLAPASLNSSSSWETQNNWLAHQRSETCCRPRQGPLCVLYQAPPMHRATEKSALAGRPIKPKSSFRPSPAPSPNPVTLFRSFRWLCFRLSGDCDLRPPGDCDFPPGLPPRNRLARELRSFCGEGFRAWLA